MFFFRFFKFGNEILYPLTSIFYCVAILLIASIAFLAFSVNYILIQINYYHLIILQNLTENFASYPRVGSFLVAIGFIWPGFIDSGQYIMDQVKNTAQTMLRYV